MKKISDKKLQKLNAKVKNLLHKLNSNQAILSSEQLSGRELKLLEDAAMADKKGEVVKVAAVNYWLLNDKFNEQQTYKAGDIIVDDIFAEKSYTGQIFGNQHMYLVTRYSHAAQLFEDKDGIIKVADLYQRHSAQPLDISRAYYTKVFRFNVENLLSPEMHHYLESQYQSPSELQNEMKRINGLFRSSINELHQAIAEDNVDGVGNKTKLNRKITNSTLRQIEAGFSAIAPTKLMQRKQGNNLGAIRDQMYARDISEFSLKEMICSEFVTNATIAALVELNDQLKIDYPGFKGEPLSLPFKQDKIKTIHPAKLVDLLLKVDAISEVRQPSVLMLAIRPSNAKKYDKAINKITDKAIKTIKKAKEEGKDILADQFIEELTLGISKKTIKAHNKIFPHNAIMITDKELKENLVVEFKESTKKLIEQYNNDSQKEGHKQREYFNGLIGKIFGKIFNIANNKKLRKALNEGVKDLAYQTKTKATIHVNAHRPESAHEDPAKYRKNQSKKPGFWAQRKAKQKGYTPL